MAVNQLNRGLKRRVMYVESKGELMEGAAARIGWVSFSKSGKSISYRGKLLIRIKGGGTSGNFLDTDSGQEYWVSGVKGKGSNTHPNESWVLVVVDEDAVEEYGRIRSGTGV